jgi:hypothetical protein
MQPLRSAVAAILLLAGLLAAVPGAPAGAGHEAGPYFDLAALPPVESTGAAIADDLEAFVSAYPYRLTGTPNELRAGEALRAEMSGLGYEAAIEPIALSNEPGAPLLKAVTATKRGTTRPDDWILLIGHYDSIATTVYGAYDNGAGTNMMRFLARELADVPTNRSIVFAWYNGEEEGLLASARHAAKLKAAGQQITAVLGFDMVGIGWPAAPGNANQCLCLYHGADDKKQAEPLFRFVNHDFLGFPDGRREVTVAGNNIRNSDEQSFDRQGYLTLRWTGLRTASAYPAYHLPHDTMDTITSTAGSRALFAEGSLNTLKSAYYTALALDNHAPRAVAAVTADGLSVTADATGSSDVDGPLGEVRWDFGDGTTATGATATHTYAAPGSYTVTLTVGDNLWPAVVTTTLVEVTVG